MDAQGLYVRGDRDAVSKLLPSIRQHKPALLAALAGRHPQAAPQPETLLDECKRLALAVMADNDTFTHEGRTLDADGAREVAFERLESAGTADLEDFAQWAVDFLEGRAKPPALAGHGGEPMRGGS